MCGLLLAVYPFNAARLAKIDECRQRYFRRIGLQRKHGFAKDRAAYHREVESAHQFAINPSLDTMRVARLKQANVGGLHGRQNPSAILSSPYGMGAVGDDLWEGRVHAGFRARVALESLNGLFE